MQHINYDFGKNWNEKIKPWLDDRKVKRAVKRGVNSYLETFPLCKERYKGRTCPASYSSRDYYATLMEKRRKKLIKQLEKEENLPKKYYRLKKRSQEDSDSETSSEDKFWEFEHYKDKICEKYFKWNNVKHELLIYYLSGSCHWWAPTFELTLARLVCPDETWRVREGQDHTTVINKDNTKIFDLLYWCSDGRLENYLFGTKVVAQDSTLGGVHAFQDSAKPPI